MNYRFLSAALTLWILLASPFLRTTMESMMVTHLLQIGLLAAVGTLLAAAFAPIRPDELAGCNRFGITGTLLALITLVFWLLPISLDRALDNSAWELAKFVTLPLLLGLPLGRSWQRLPVVARAALWANAIPMLIVMGWLYHEAPVRLCNNYLINDQILLGRSLWCAAVVIAAYWGLHAVFHPLLTHRISLGTLSTERHHSNRADHC